MGVKDDIRWLQEMKDRLMLFIQIAKEDNSGVKKLKEVIGFDDWWPVKNHLEDLEDRGLIEESGDGEYRISEEGKKVFESLSTVSDIESV